MRYGYFDDSKREYVIERPDTPASWSNYLGNTNYGAIITNNAGGYSFYKSAASGRFMRLRFNNVPLDQPGRYLYLRDKETADYWSASWQPVGKPLDEFKSECRHGAAYSIITSQYKNINSETTYFVPLNENFECWILKIKNTDSKPRTLQLFTYVEVACNWNLQDDSNNLQYTQYISSADVKNNIMVFTSNLHLNEYPDNFEEKDQKRNSFIALCGSEVAGFETEREKFLGMYGTYKNPVVVETGCCGNTLLDGGNPCGCFQTEMELTPGEEKNIIVLMGIGDFNAAGIAIQKLGDTVKAEVALGEIKKHWHQILDRVKYKIPDAEVQSMMNMWSPFNCLVTFNWSRAASLIYAGERDGLGYRDTVQDILGVLPYIPGEAKERLTLMLTGQVSSGGAMPVIKQFSHRPGFEKAPAENDYRSDDCMWLFNTIPSLVKETGDTNYFSEVLPYADKGKDTVFGHMKKAIEFSIERKGVHGLPLGLSADWNDAIRLGDGGESVFVAFQLRYALQVYSEIASLLKDDSEKLWAAKHLSELDENIEKYAWDGEWYLRGLTKEGEKFGSKENSEGMIYLNPQAWSVISGHAPVEKAKKAMDAVNKYLFTDNGIMLCMPPYEKIDPGIMRGVFFNNGTKENAGIFSHPNGWGVMAEAILKNNQRAFNYYKAYLPASYNDKCEVREIEPYVYCQSTFSTYSRNYGKAKIPWLTGAAAWAYHSFTEYILGLKPEYNGWMIAPCLPESMKVINISRIFRDKYFEIEMINDNQTPEAKVNIIFNGQEIEGRLIPDFLFQNNNTVKVFIS